MRVQHNGGFFLLELVIVVLLICIMSAIVFTNSTLLTKQQIKCQMQELYAAIMYTHRLAITTGKPQVIAFDMEKGTYKVQDTLCQLAQGVMFSFLPNTKGPPSSPTLPVKEAITFVDKKLNAYQDGTMQAGTIYMTDSKKEYMYALTVPAGHVSHIQCYVFDTVWKKI